MAPKYALNLCAATAFFGLRGKAPSLPLIVIRHCDLPRDDRCLQLVGSLAHWLSQYLRVVLIEGIVHALIGEPEPFDAPSELPGLRLLNRRIHRFIHTLQHTRQDQPWLGPVLVGIHTNRELLLVLRRIEHSQARGASRGEDHIRTALIL